MGQIRKFRQRIMSQVASLQAKTLYNYLANDIHEKWEMPVYLARMLADDVLDCLAAQGLRRLPGEIEIEALDRAARNSRRRAECGFKPIKLAVYTDDDYEVLAEFGVAAMQLNRICRWIEQAHCQEALFDRILLSQLIPLGDRVVRKRLGGLRKLGIKVPFGVRYRSDQGALMRHAWLVEKYLTGEDFRACRCELAVSEHQWERWWKGFRTCEWLRRQGRAPLEVAQSTGWPVQIVRDWYQAAERLSTRARQELDDLLIEPDRCVVSGTDTKHRLLKTLREGYGFSWAATDRFIRDLDALQEQMSPVRDKGQIVYFAVSQDEPPGSSLAECELVLVVLDYLHPDDIEVADPDSTKALKWQRLMRLSTQAYAQGGCLSQADLAFLLGISVDAVQAAIKEHDKIILPTRGQVIDIGSSPSHAEKIITLFMDGYSEIQIARRTGHSLASIERYLIDFGRVVVLKEHGLPLPVLRQVIGRSRRVVEKYLGLYERFNHSDYDFRMARIRRIGVAHHPKGRISRKDGGCMDLTRRGNRYASLPKKQVEPVQKAHLRKCFELAERSVKAEALVRRTNQVASQWEAANGITRVPPGYLVIEHDGKKGTLPILTKYWADQLAAGYPQKLVKRQLEQEQMAALRRICSGAQITDLWRWTDQWSLCCRPAPEALVGRVPPRKTDYRVMNVTAARNANTDKVITIVGDWFTREYGVPPSLARGMIEAALHTRNLCMPLLDDLQPGQLIWLARGLRKTRGLAPEDLRPVILTLITPEEAHARMEHRGHACRLKLRQLERVTIQTFRQNAVLTNLDLELMLNVSSAVLKRLLDRYYEAHNVLLPTAGSVLDMGTTVTHKAIVIDMFLEGKATEEIASSIFHTPMAVERYINDFENYLTLTYFNVPEKVIPKILGKSESLMQEYRTIVSNKLPTRNDIHSYLASRGIV